MFWQNLLDNLLMSVLGSHEADEIIRWSELGRGNNETIPVLFNHFIIVIIIANYTIINYRN